MAFDPGLVDTLVSGARTYGAPELVELTTLGIALAMRGYTLGSLWPSWASSEGQGTTRSLQESGSGCCFSGHRILGVA